MSTRQDDVLNPDEIYDFIYIVGKDNPDQTYMQMQYEQVKKECEAKGLKYFILGDGKKDLELKDFDSLPQARHAFVIAHGLIINGHHTSCLQDPPVNSIDVINKLQEKTKVRDLVYCACYGGKIGQELENSEYRLLEGTNLILPSPPDDVSLGTDSELILTRFLNQIKPGLRTSLVRLFVDIFHAIPQSMTMVNQSAQEKPELFKIRRLDRAIWAQAEKLCKQRLMEFGEATKTWLIDNKDEEINFISSYTMSHEQIEAYHQQSLILHVLYSDAEVMDLLLENMTSEKQYVVSLALCRMIVNAPENVTAHLKLLEVLIKHGGNVDDVSSILIQTPLTLALEYDQIHLVKALIAHGADIFKPDGNGKIPADILHDDKYKSLFGDLRKRGNNTAALGEILLNPEFAQLLDNNPPLKALILDVQAKKDAFEQLCHEQGDQRFYSGETHVPKNKAVYDSFISFTNAANKIPYPDRLLAPDNTFIEEHAKEKVGKDLLVIAVQKGKLEIVELLLSSGLDPNIRAGQPPRDPLSFAIENGHDKIVRALINKNVPVEYEHILNAAKNGNLGVFNIVGKKYVSDLKKNNISNDTLSPLLHETTNVKIIAQLLKQKDIDINRKDSNGKTPLAVACERNSLDIVKLLLSKGASVTDQGNYNLLDLAASPEIRSELLAAGLKVTVNAEKIQNVSEQTLVKPVTLRPDPKQQYPAYCQLWSQAFEEIQTNPDFQSIKGNTDKSNVHAIKVILNDYTKGGDTWWAAFKRAITGHWNRHHVKEVDAVVKNIDNQTISSTKDLLSALDAIVAKGVNPVGRFKEQLSFITRQLDITEQLDPETGNDLKM